MLETRKYLPALPSAFLCGEPWEETENARLVAKPLFLSLRLLFPSHSSHLQIHLLFQPECAGSVCSIPHKTLQVCSSGCSSVLSESGWLLHPPQCTVSGPMHALISCCNSFPVRSHDLWNFFLPSMYPWLLQCRSNLSATLRTSIWHSPLKALYQLQTNHAGSLAKVKVFDLLLFPLHPHNQLSHHREQSDWSGKICPW